jgi:hypothetical protein
MIQQHFQGQAISQLYSLLGSLSLLGNPLGSIARLGDGAKARLCAQSRRRIVGAS